MCLKREKEAMDNTETARKNAATEKYTHLLIGKVKDTQIIFSYIIEASVVEQTGPANVS
jgi:hypothetical protein